MPNFLRDVFLAAVVDKPVIYTLGLIGVGVFAVTGVLSTARKNFDILGVIIIAIATAIGGGTLRDVLLDRHPIFWVKDPAYLYVILGSTLGTLIYVRFIKPPLRALLIADALGLAMFTISGAQIAEEQNLPGAAIVVMATITGAAGGMVRDLLCNEVPLLMRPGELYATTSIVGASAYIILQANGVSRSTASLIGVATVALLRFAAIFWKLKLPVAELPEHSN